MNVWVFYYRVMGFTNYNGLNYYRNIKTLKGIGQF